MASQISASSGIGITILSRALNEGVSLISASSGLFLQQQPLYNVVYEFSWRSSLQSVQPSIHLLYELLKVCISLCVE
jgi:hypothetical protein